MRSITALVVSMLCLSVASRALAQQDVLKPGDPAPKLQPGKWIKGEPVKEFEKGKVYVVEFWATWCGPCIRMMPHLSELQAKHKDVVFIGQNIWEEDVSRVEPFVAKQGDKMAYRVAMDDKTTVPDGIMQQTWMRAAGQDGIPACFVVNQEGRIAWIGHPGELESVLEPVIKKEYDIEKAAKVAQVRQKLMQALMKQDAAAAMTSADELAAADPKLVPQMSVLKFNILIAEKRYDEAWKLAEGFVDGPLKDDPQALNELAWRMVSNEQIEKPNLDLALKIATAANTKAEGKDAPILDTLAAVHAKKGDFDKAIEIQKQAVQAAGDKSDMANEMKETLAGYEKQKQAQK